jgi:hypothetical protein
MEFVKNVKKETSSQLDNINFDFAYLGSLVFYTIINAVIIDDVQLKYKKLKTDHFSDIS